MSFSIEVPANPQTIQLIDELMKSYVTLYNIPHQRELCFVLHELVINAIEAMEKDARLPNQKITIQVERQHVCLHMKVIDCASGIPEHQWNQVLQYDFEEMGDSDRGRGLFFIQHMVDRIWFEYVAPTRFLVGVSKRLTTDVEEMT